MIYSLSVWGLGRMLLYIIGVYFVIKILSRLLSPFLIKFAAKKMEDRFGQQFNQQRQQQRPNQKEGETVIDKMPSKENSSNKKVGEYIDYEEID